MFIPDGIEIMGKEDLEVTRGMLIEEHRVIIEAIEMVEQRAAELKARETYEPFKR